LSKLLLSLLSGSLLFSACSKDKFEPIPADPAKPTPCQFQTANPAGRTYAASSVVDFTCTEKHCGILPLSSKNYWVYEDSVFDNGFFLRVQYDTLRYISTKKSLEDGLIWWESNISVGLPELLYANDSAFFTLTERLFNPEVKDAKKDFSVPSGDSLRYLTSFEDAAANGRSVKLQAAVITSAGSFSNCIYFEKNARNYRRDQVYFKPGLGVVRYIQEKAQPGSPVVKLQQISTLVAIHIE
jgi:hypothetical protein